MQKRKCVQSLNISQQIEENVENLPFYKNNILPVLIFSLFSIRYHRIAKSTFALCIRKCKWKKTNIFLHIYIKSNISNLHIFLVAKAKDIFRSENERQEYLYIYLCRFWPYARLR